VLAGILLVAVTYYRGHPSISKPSTSESSEQLKQDYARLGQEYVHELRELGLKYPARRAEVCAELGRIILVDSKTGQLQGEPENFYPTQSSASLALGMLTPESEPYLMQGMRSKNELVREDTITALFGLPASELAKFLPILRQLEHDPNSNVRSSAGSKVKEFYNP
jgi:hypothetical protein